MASLSSTTPQTQWWKYDVFLSFRGVDTRKKFVDHIYKELFKRAFDIFKDNKTLMRGEYITPALLKAIGESRFAVVVFSKRYADSSFCLIELAEIMSCSKKNGLIVLPVFYDVEVSDVKRQLGDFGAGFKKHKLDVNQSIWRQALVDAANVAGWGPNRYEVKTVEEIIERISLGLSCCPNNSTVDRNLIGIEPRMQYVKSMMENQSGSGGRMIGIWGIEGGGKTTLATAIYKQEYLKFGGRCSFIEIIKDESKHNLKKLQEKLLEDIFKGRYNKLGSLELGKSEIAKRMRQVSVLIVLDDVSDRSQLKALAGADDWFGEGSRIIITSRKRDLLETHGVHTIHEVCLLKEWEAIHLFNRHAFREGEQPREFKELSLKAVRYASGLPLALEVFGSLFSNKKTVAEWITVLDSLKTVCTKDIFDILRISYDELIPIAQEMFLEIACFFRNQEKDEVSQVLKARGFETTDHLLNVLQDYSLIRISNGRLQMHDLIQEMGRWFILSKHPKRTRIWEAEELVKICAGDIQIKKKSIKGIQVRVDDNSPLDFSDAFTGMENLRYLDISLFPMWKDRSGDDIPPKVLPRSLQWLSWSNYPGKSLTACFQAKFLVGMRVTSSKIVQLWEDKIFEPLLNLKMLDLSDSKYLLSITNFHLFPNLERLKLQRCRNLKIIDDSIGNLDKLVLLDMSCCSGLKEFPPLVYMKLLEVLIFSGCSNLKRFPDIAFNLDSLKHLSLQHSGIERLPPEIARIDGLLSIDLSNCKRLETLPYNFGQLKCLKSLKLSGCTKLKLLPSDMTSLISLEELVLDNTGIAKLPALHLNNLKTLSFKH
ncbi:hypothetical protein CTI12_AA344390 [Artemisia annua]|uniref:TIR domain-containing protein n=1 Tax=Artemisia annua TaxID=35608 RepID=A0A2U1MT98_ARTAN|nr:hypothetical protein CTI12_AA344390 [Artemisia annua]